ncbi:sensor histidine kinase [Nocardioides dilutus]
MWGLFPYPTYATGRFEDGALKPAPEICRRCSKLDCARDTQTPVGQVTQCRFGVSYAQLDEERLVLGVVVTDNDMTTRRARSVSRKYPDMRVKGSQLRAAVAAVRELGTVVLKDFGLAQEQILNDLKTNPEMHESLAMKLRKDFEANLDQSHDFLQLVKLVRGHAEALLLQNHPGKSVVEAAESEPNLGAIYFSTELMLVKMDALVFLREINRALGSPVTFQVHPHVLKYVRIYDWQARQKDLRIYINGSSHERVTLNSAAVGAVIQGLLDNLVKYAPAGSEAAITFSETTDHVQVVFSSLGPRIERREEPQIFLPGFRAAAAKEMEQSGLGIGLATAREICTALDLELTVSQSTDEDEKYRGRYATTFTLVFPL